jgi:hypothetical protein
MFLFYIHPFFKCSKIPFLKKQKQSENFPLENNNNKIKNENSYDGQPKTESMTFCLYSGPSPVSSNAACSDAS